MGTKTVERSNEKREKEFSRKGHRKVLTFDPDECFTLEMGQMNTRYPSTIIEIIEIDRSTIIEHPNYGFNDGSDLDRDRSTVINYWPIELAHHSTSRAATDGNDRDDYGVH